MKPAYRVPTMAEIEAIPANGLKVASLFAGIGGSSLGYRMAGYRVLWASELIAGAAAVYRMNHPKTIVDERDIRMVKSEEILEKIGLQVGELDVLDGSPPCTSFSTVGQRERGWNKLVAYGSHMQRVDNLFYEYIRLVREMLPRMFIAENVAGLARGVSIGHFNQILCDLKACGYRVAVRLLNAQWLGLPQHRLRLFFIGVREDLAREPVFPAPSPYRYAVREVLPHIMRIEEAGGYSNRVFYCSTKPIGAILASQNVRVEVINEDSPMSRRRQMTIGELKLLSSLPEDFQLSGSNASQRKFIGNMVPPLMMRAVATAARSILSPAVQLVSA